ncbi:hypothetical protein BDW71DRAFT_195516 [Aspergillus fruticulosus]
MLKYLQHKLGLFHHTTNSMASQAQVEALAPNTVQRHLNDLQCYCGAYVVLGLDFIWSIDGYLKLVLYRFEIYTAIDAYSCYIIWIYMGTSSHTAVSVLQQFLDVL